MREEPVNRYGRYLISMQKKEPARQCCSLSARESELTLQIITN